MRHPSRLISLLPLAAVLAACNTEVGGEPVSYTSEIDTVAGVVHVTHSGDGVWATGTPWRADTVRAVEIGAIDGADPYIFGSVTGVVVGEGGRIFVADGQAKEIRIFSPEGEFLDRFGRSGEGPGEFGNISGLGRAPEGGVAVLDGAQARVSVFDAEGEFGRSFRIERPHMFIRSGSSVRFDNQGRYHDLTQLSRTPGVDSLGVVRYHPTGAVLDTVLMAVDDPEEVMIMQNGRPSVSFALAFAPHTSGAIGPDGRIYATLGAEYHIARLDPSGDTLRTVRRQVKAVPVSPAARDSAHERMVELYTTVTGVPPRDLPALPFEMPAIQALQLDESGHLWVLRGTADPSVMEWDLFDSEGGYFGAVSFPAMHVMHFGENTIAGVVRDELDVPRVRVIPIVRE